MAQQITYVDSFTDKLFGGNPAGVCILSAPVDTEWMQQIAAELNLPAIAFMYQQADGYNLRWFTSLTELALCGHATLASAHVLWEAGYLASEQQARFYTKSGLLTATKAGNWIEMDFPALYVEEAALPPQVLEAVGVTGPIFMGKSRIDYLIELESEAAVMALKPNFTELKNVAKPGVILTSRATRAGYDFVSRVFVPADGIDEDFVTGSAHCVLATYWAAKLGKNQMLAYQASSRGGILRLQVNGERVLLGGQAITVMRSELL